ncbi:MAG: Hydrogenase expression/formation protein HypE [bacterium ADurb.Bin243]|nr:MAG: Hydrogenase expression/formation protein HypE [bacterium ADurb.Bin243]
MGIFSQAGDFILEAHGNGGKLTHELIAEVFAAGFKNETLNEGLDSAVMNIGSMLESVKAKSLADCGETLAEARLALTTDSYVVSPLFFNGGDIGKLAVTGTLNDLLVCGAVPCAITCGFIIEEGFKISELKKIVSSMAETAAKNGVSIVTGDTKVVGRGRCDGVYINTAGAGLVINGADLKPANIKAGDAVIITGVPGNHGICILNERGGYVDKNSVRSDCAPLSKPLISLMNKVKDIKVMRDPTRGGVATTLNEFVKQNGEIGIELLENSIEYDKNSKALADILGIDLLYSACEGRALIICSKESADEALNELKKFEETAGAKVIGYACAKNKGRVIIKTSVGGARILDMQVLEQFPRIC